MKMFMFVCLGGKRGRGRVFVNEQDGRFGVINLWMRILFLVDNSEISDRSYETKSITKQRFVLNNIIKKIRIATENSDAPRKRQARFNEQKIKPKLYEFMTLGNCKVNGLLLQSKKKNKKKNDEVSVNQTSKSIF